MTPDSGRIVPPRWRRTSGDQTLGESNPAGAFEGRADQRRIAFTAGSGPGAELARRTWREVVDDDVLGLAAQLSYYFFLALFPAILFLTAVASFFPLSNITDDVGRSLGPFVSPQVSVSTFIVDAHCSLSSSLTSM